MKQNIEEQMIIFGLAALFRAAGIARQSDQEAREVRDDLAITQAERFLQKCKDEGVYPKEKPKEKL